MAWTFQDPKRKAKLGEDKCPWSAGWIDPDGRKRSKKLGSKSAAEKYKRKVEGQIAAGTYQANDRKTWVEFRKEFERRIANVRMSVGNRNCTLGALDVFERIARPVRMRAIKTETIEDFVAKRLQEPGYKAETLSAATCNKELRHLRAVLRRAHKWGYLARVPDFDMLREGQGLPRYVPPEDFAKIYGACDHARLPASDVYSTGDWWRAVLTFAYLTGWRISEILSLKWDDVSLDKGQAITRSPDNKGRRDEVAPLHPILVEHLRKIADPFSPLVFWWPHHERTIWVQFFAIQIEAGIPLTCGKKSGRKHKHTSLCGLYAFHDVRRAFATVNADRLTPDALQALMRHKSYATTKRYINMSRQLNRAADNLFVPDVLRNASGG